MSLFSKEAVPLSVGFLYSNNMGVILVYKVVKVDNMVLVSITIDIPL